MPSKKHKEIDKKELFSRIEFFDDLPDDVLEHLIDISVVQSFRSEETIVLAGDTRRAMFFIAKGSARIISDGKSGRETILGLLGVGDLFGEHFLFEQETINNISVCAEDECVILMFGRKDFLKELEGNIKLSMRFITILTHRLNKLHKQLVIASMNTVRSRIIACIMLFIDEKGKTVKNKNGENVIVLRNRPTQQEIAAMCGTTRESANREIASFIKQGFIELGDKDLILLKELK